jgi:hypothetical protein
MATLIPAGILPQLHGPSSLANYEGCIAMDGPSTSSPLCRLGDTSAKRTLVLFGDSHAQVWLPALLYFATVDHWLFIPIVKQGCVPEQWTGYEEAPECRGWFKWALQQMQNIKPDATVIGGAYSFSVWKSADVMARDLRGFLLEIHDVEKWSRHVVVLEDTPHLQESPPQCVPWPGATFGSCTFPVPAGLNALQLEVQAMAAGAGAGFVTTMSFFCAEGLCPLVVWNTIAYLDQGHISYDYAKELDGPMAVELKAALG